MRVEKVLVQDLKIGDKILDESGNQVCVTHIGQWEPDYKIIFLDNCPDGDYSINHYVSLVSG